jgi:hypothetical protein
LNSAKKETKKLVESMSPSICSSSVQGLHLSQPGEKKGPLLGLLVVFSCQDYDPGKQWSFTPDGLG